MSDVSSTFAQATLTNLALPYDTTTAGSPPPSLRPLGAALLAGALGASASAWAQNPAADGAAATLPTVTVQDAKDGSTTSKAQVRATRTQIGKGDQALRDIPQSVTVMTEKLLQERNLDDFREVLRTTAGVTFLAGETGEEDVRLRGFSLGTAGDIYRDGMRDAPLIERDTFNDDRIEVIKGSASMLFGKGSTGGVVNQVSKQPFLMDQHEASLTLGNGEEKRITADFNWMTGPNAALRLNLVGHDAKNWGAQQRKLGLAPTFRWGIGTANEFSVGLYHVEAKGRPNYSHPRFVVDGVITPVLPARNYYGLNSDKQNSTSTYLTLSHLHRFAAGGELKTQLRHGKYERDLWASVIRFGQTNGQPTTIDNWGPDTIITRTPKGRIGDSTITQLQSDYSNTFKWGGMEHKLLAGVDIYYDDARRNNSYAGPGSGLTTTVGQPNNGDWRADPRDPPIYNTFRAHNLGLYVQDTVALTPTFKLLGGLRFDHFKASYHVPERTNNSGAIIPARDFEKTENLWSPRIGLLYQPSDTQSYYMSFGTSYNTSGDAYQYTPGSPNERLSNTPPEKSRNLEIGGKWELFDQRLSFGAALFYSEKYNERNQDPDSAATQFLLSGKRHAAGVELNAAGRITPAWELFWNHTWIPDAKIDRSNQQANPNNPDAGPQRQGDRPGLTPRHSGSLWTTYRVMPQLRLGLGANYRSSQSPDGVRNQKARGFATLDLMAEYSFTEKTTLRLNVTNATNKLYADALYRGFYSPNAPRRYQLTLKHMF